MSLIDRENLQCQLCGFQRNKVELLIPHLGSAHDKLEDFLPIQFHLPRSKPVKYAKIASVLHPVELNQSTFEQTLEESKDTGTSVNCHLEEEIPRTLDPDCQDCQQPEDPIYIEYLQQQQQTDTTQSTLQSQNKDTDSQENSAQAFMDEDDFSDIRNIFDSDED